MPSFRDAPRFALVMAPLLALGLTVTPAQAIPSFARQTKMPCSACHTQFPELTEFGRMFKLNGYTLSAIEKIEAADAAGAQELSLNLMPIVSIMAQVSMTELAKAQQTLSGRGNSPNGSVLLPDQLSIFLAGAITPKIGAFVQVTYYALSGSLHLDNTSLRFATQGTLLGQPTTLGLSVNNNPTVQDLWNSTPVWGFPYLHSAVTPPSAGASLIDGTLAQEVAGLSGYAYWNNAVYGEFGVYRSSPIGTPQPFDSATGANGIIDGVAPYWRVALTKTFGDNYIEVGTYGMAAKRQPGAFVPGGGTDSYTDLALDAQFMRTMGHNSLTVTGTWIHESRSLGASVAGGGASVATQTLDTYRVRGTYHVGQRYALSVGPFITNGTTDATLYPTGGVIGSSAGSPNTTGAILEADYMPWQNTRIALQYTAYGKFNGRSSNYDGAGRNAADNNTLYAVAWLMF
jgi:hypothetical protein